MSEKTIEVTQLEDVTYAHTLVSKVLMNTRSIGHIDSFLYEKLLHCILQFLTSFVFSDITS